MEATPSSTRRSTRSSTLNNKRSANADPSTTNTSAMPNKSRTKPSARKTKASTPATKSTSSSGHARGRGAVYYERHIAFYGGILSNFHIGEPFRGIAILKHVLPALHNLAIPHPAPNSVASQMILSHNFICGEQVMMALKSYLFECPAVPAANEVVGDKAGESLEELGVGREAIAAMKGTNLEQVLTARDPKKIKALGRQCPNFDPAVWDRASPSVVTAACLARAKANETLADLYDENLIKEEGEVRLKKGFVEGSPSDKIWGVGMGFDDRRIDDPKNWRGENRLGRCHDDACLLFGGGLMKHATAEVEKDADVVAAEESARSKHDTGGEADGSLAAGGEAVEQHAGEKA